MKQCPRCAEDIQDAARACRHCGYDLSASTRFAKGTSRMGCGGLVLWLIIGVLALAAVGYFLKVTGG